MKMDVSSLVAVICFLYSSFKSKQNKILTILDKNVFLNIFTGIPDNPEVADTFYSQYEDFDKSSSDEEEMQTVIKKNSDQGTLVSGSTLTSVGGNEEGQLYDLLQNVLEKGDDAGTYI